VPIVAEIDAGELEGLALSLQVDRRAMEAAAAAAARRAISWARTQIARGLAARLGVREQSISKRLKQRSKGKRTSLWIALNPLNLASVGHTKASGGLRAGAREYHGGFVARGRYGGRVAMRRAGSSRTPLVAVSIDVLAVAPSEISRGAWPGLNERFIAFYQEELARRA
jgi:hypothetical protein